MPPETAAEEVILQPSYRRQRTRWVRTSSAVIVPFQAPKRSSPSTTTGDDSIGEPTVRCHRRWPSERDSAHTWPSMPWTISSSPTIAGDEASLPCGMSWRQTRLPSLIESALIEPRALPMYATPSATTAGNSISAPRPRDQTIRNGGRTFRAACAWSRCTVAPYTGHCSAWR